MFISKHIKTTLKSPEIDSVIYTLSLSQIKKFPKTPLYIYIYILVITCIYYLYLLVITCLIITCYYMEFFFFYYLLTLVITSLLHVIYIPYYIGGCTKTPITVIWFPLSCGTKIFMQNF